MVRWRGEDITFRPSPRISEVAGVFFRVGQIMKSQVGNFGKVEISKGVAQDSLSIQAFGQIEGRVEVNMI